MCLRSVKLEARLLRAVHRSSVEESGGRAKRHQARQRVVPAFVLLGHCWAKVAWWPLPQLLPATKSHGTTTVLILSLCVYSVPGSAINLAASLKTPPVNNLRRTYAP